MYILGVYRKDFRFISGSFLRCVYALSLIRNKHSTSKSRAIKLLDFYEVVNKIVGKDRHFCSCVTRRWFCNKPIAENWMLHSKNIIVNPFKDVCETSLNPSNLFTKINRNSFQNKKKKYILKNILQHKIFWFPYNFK